MMYRPGHFRYFLIFSTTKNDFLPFSSSKFDWERAFLNRTGAEIG